MQPSVNILLVDDDPRNLDVLEAILAKDGYGLLRASDASAALTLLLHQDVAAIIMDVMMPGMDGYELARTIQGSKRYRQIPILFLSGRLLENQDIAAGYGAGAVDYLTKPINPAILRHKIAVFAELWSKTRALAELNATLEERVMARTAAVTESERALREADTLKNEFLAVLAHELRNPLAPLRTGLAILSQSAARSGSSSATLEIMNRQVQHMVRLIDDLLDVSRISRGVLELKPEPTDLGELLRSTIASLEANFAKSGHRLSLRIDEAVVAVADRVRIAQIVGNLLHNAGKFTPEGGTISVTLSRSNGHAAVRVTDNGAGIDQGDLGRIFDMFARLDVSSRDRGLGIGLALSRKLAALHGGDLTAESEGPGRGATFTLSLPAPLQSAGAAATNGSTTPAAGRLWPFKVLVIEDNLDSAEMLSEWLTEKGLRVSVAHDGKQGIDLLLMTNPHLVLCDLGLPQLSGLEVCRWVRGHKAEASPVMVALSGWGAPADREATAAAGFDQHFVKPVDLSQLEIFISRLAIPDSIDSSAMQSKLTTSVPAHEDGAAAEPRGAARPIDCIVAI